QAAYVAEAHCFEGTELLLCSCKMMYMDDVPIAGRDSDARVFKQVLAHFSAPAYVVRARQVEQAFEDLIHRCTRRRDEWLKDIRRRLSSLCSVEENCNVIRRYMSNDEQFSILLQLSTSPGETKGQPGQLSFGRATRRELRELRSNIERFNKKW